MHWKIGLYVHMQVSVWDTYLLVGLSRSLFKKIKLWGDCCPSQYFRGSLQFPLTVICVLVLTIFCQRSRSPLLTHWDDFLFFFAFLDLHFSFFVYGASDSWFFSVLSSPICFLFILFLPSLLLCFILHVIWGAL